jgi:hypothetical protein
MIGWAVIGREGGQTCLVPDPASMEAPCMTEQPTGHQPAASTRPSRTAWAAYAACALALLSAIPSFYWAAGGTIGLDTVGGAIEELARARDPAGVALVRPRGRRVPRRLLGGVAWAASVVLTLYGGLLVAVGALVLAGVIRPAGPVDRTALRWHVLVWDLWFVVWGLLLGLAAWHYGRQSRDRGAR